jgi:hypothetical protein
MLNARGPAGSRLHTCARAAARAAAMRARPAAPTSASARPTVVSEAIGPYSSACARNPSTSIMSRAPQPIVQTTSVSTRPRSCTGRKSDLASTADSRSVRPVRSASIRSGTPPGHRHHPDTVGRNPQIPAP